MHTSELADPGPYLEGGELLLTTGLELPVADPVELRAYVRRLAAAGVVGLGFGVGVGHDAVPRALVAAAAQERAAAAGGAAQDAVHRHQQNRFRRPRRRAYKSVTAGFEAQRELTRAALAHRGPRRRCWTGSPASWTAGPRCTTPRAPWWPRPPTGRAGGPPRLAGEIERMRASGPGAAVTGPAGGEDRVELQSLGTGRRPRGYLAVGTEERLDTSARYAVNAAVALLTLSLEQSRTLQRAHTRLAAAVLRMVLTGETGHARSVAGSLYRDLLDHPVKVLIAEPADEAARRRRTRRARRARGDRRRTLGEPLLAIHDDARLTVLAAEGATALAATADHAEADDALAAGLSAGVPPEEAPEAHRQAERALAVAVRRGRNLVEHGEVGAGSVLPLLADDAVRAFAEGLLRPLREHDATSRGDLVASLHAWLSHHGQWDAAAADLGVHRHTLRYRMRRVEEILGRSLDDPDVRMELWLALKTEAESEAPS